MGFQPPPSDAQTTNVVALDTLIVKRGPGRPRSFIRAPTEAERARRENVRARLHQHVSADPLVGITSKPADRKSIATLDVVMLEIAREAAGISFDAERAVVESRPTPERLSTRKINALAKIGELLLERTRVGIEEHFDPFDPRVQRVVAAFFEKMREAADETLTHSEAEKFFARFNEMAGNWEQKVER